MKTVVLTDSQINALLYTLSDVIETYEEGAEYGDGYDQTVAEDLKDIQEQLRSIKEDN